MKPVILFLTLMTMTALGADQKPAAKKAKAAPASATVSATRKVPEITIPEGAVETEPFTYHYTDPQGTKWIYRKTPWGVARMEDKPNAERVQKPEPVDLTKVTETGDSLIFEKPGPFGTYRWEKKKADLDDKERAAWERSRNSAATKQE